MPVTVASAILLPGPQSVCVSISTQDLRDVPDIRVIVTEVAPEEEPQFIELMLATNFAVRQLSNLGGGRETDDLADRLENLRYDEMPEVAALSDIGGLKVDTNLGRADMARRIDVELRFAEKSSELWVKPSGSYLRGCGQSASPAYR